VNAAAPNYPLLDPLWGQPSDQRDQAGGHFCALQNPRAKSRTYQEFFTKVRTDLPQQGNQLRNAKQVCDSNRLEPQPKKRCISQRGGRREAKDHCLAHRVFGRRKRLHAVLRSQSDHQV
jgi:hypothetical protein